MTERTPTAEALEKARTMFMRAPAPGMGALPHTPSVVEVALALEDFAAQAVDPLEKRLREEWWMNHGCDFAAKYGDDGEMQCNARECRTDFKRMPLNDLEARVLERRMARLAKVIRG